MKLASFGLALILCLSFVAVGQQKNFSRFEGLYYILNSNESDERAIVISFDNKPIPPKSNDPGAPTVPGYYPSKKRFGFEKVKIVGKTIYFKTLAVAGVTYEFRGTFAEKFDPYFSESIPYIKGKLIKLGNGKVVKTVKIRFGHTVVY